MLNCEVAYEKTIREVCDWYNKLPDEMKNNAILFGSVASRSLFCKSYLARKSGKKATDVDIYVKNYDAFYDVETGIMSIDLGEAKELGLKLLGTDGIFDYVPNPDYILGFDQLLPTEYFIQKVPFRIGDKIVDLFIEIDRILHQYHFDHNLKRPVFSPVGFFELGKYDEEFAEIIKKKALETGKLLKEFCKSKGHLVN